LNNIFFLGFCPYLYFLYFQQLLMPWQNTQKSRNRSTQQILSRFEVDNLPASTAIVATNPITAIHKDGQSVGLDQN